MGGVGSGRYVRSRGGRRPRVALALVVVSETDKAYKVDLDGVFTTWLPKSQVTRAATGQLVMPRWLAENKGII